MGEHEPPLVVPAVELEVEGCAARGRARRDEGLLDDEDVHVVGCNYCGDVPENPGPVIAGDADAVDLRRFHRSQMR